MNIIIDKMTKEIGKNKLKKMLSFFDGKFIRNEENRNNIELIATINNHVINQDKYTARIYNIVDALKCFAADNNLQLLFITCTLPSEYHRYKTVDGEQVKNEKYAHKNLELYDIFTKKRAHFFTKPIIKFYKTIKKRKWTNKVKKISLIENDYSAHHGYKELIKKFSKIRKDRSWTNIDKNLRIFFYVIEPTRNLIPHMHIVMWVPKINVNRIVETFFRFSPYPETHIYTKSVSESLLKKYKTGINVCNSNIINYALKYLNNIVDENEEVSDLALWYLAHKITPFSSSRSFIPQDIYKKLQGKLTLYDATKNYYANAIRAWDNTENKKLLKVFINNEIIWTKQIYTIHNSSSIDTKTVNQYENSNKRIPKRLKGGK